MNTSYITVYTRFLNKITDHYILTGASDEELYRYCHALMISAVAKLHPIEHDLSDFNDKEEEFNHPLSNLEVECIAIQMTAEWADSQIHNETLTMQYFGTEDNKFYSQADHLEKLIRLRDSETARVQKLCRDYTYRNSTYYVQS